MRPRTVNLTSGAQALSLKLHSFDALEVDHVIEVHPGAFQPSIRQRSRRSTIDFATFGFLATPFLVFSTSSGCITNHHEAIFARIGDNRLVGQGSVLCFSIDWLFRQSTLNGDTSGQFRRGPSAIFLAVSSVFANELEPGNALMLDLWERILVFSSKSLTSDRPLKPMQTNK